TANRADGGAGVFVQDGGLIIRDCIFDENRSWAGAGIYIDVMPGVEPYPVIENCQFESNDVDTTEGFPDEPSYGGAIALVGGPVTIRNCTFTGNTSGISVPEDMGGYGGAIVLNNTEALVEGCTFSGNYAKYGGAVCAQNETGDTLRNCTFSDNSGELGSGIYILLNTIIKLENCLIAYGGTGQAVECDSETPQAT
ncbi:MAG: right-handed parallel beta-helix repeat-containing protein, partial [Planctomycetes bacterium]|nr:right-handed parallel beta-helix repeat-containing protein [Planctomycetota bacterium]